MAHARWLLLFTSTLWLLTGCGDDDTPPGDSGTPVDGGGVDAPGTDASDVDGFVPPSDAGPCMDTVCGSLCVDVQTNPDHCGGCDSPCGVAQACSGGTCGDVAPTAEGDLVVDVIATNLEVVWEILFLSPDELLITERPGRVSRVAIADGAVTELGTLPVAARGEGGLMGMALDPDFATNNRLYVCYTYNDGGGPLNRLSRLSYSRDAVSDEMVLLEDIPGASNHNGCRIGFADDGTMLMTTGDAGDASSAQDPDSLAGKVLRLNADGSIPADNPTAGSYVYSLGHRNPQGLDWNPATREPFVSEHGPTTDDEVNHVMAGANYGWPMYGGAPGIAGFEDAIYDWTPTIAPAGAVFYHRTEIPGWRGSFLVLTLADRDIRRLVPTDLSFTEVASEEILFNRDYGRLRAIRVGPDGFVYIGTSRRDGRGSPGPDDDRILRIRI
jgi:glucose/arabinose dehydrogenase